MSQWLNNGGSFLESSDGSNSCSSSGSEDDSPRSRREVDTSKAPCSLDEDPYHTGKPTKYLTRSDWDAYQFANEAYDYFNPENEEPWKMQVDSQREKQ